MKRVLVFTCALVASTALAGSSSQGTITRGNYERIPDYNTTANTAWFISPTGADTGNTCLSAASPCLTPQRVVTLIGAKHLRHQQVIYAAAGSYPCVVFSGTQTDNNYNLSASSVAGALATANGAGIALIGTMANSTLTTGTATGTITSSVTGSTTLGVTYTTITDSTQAWTTDNLKGRFVSFANGTRQVIYSNTATALTASLTSAAPANGTPYTIQDAASFLNSSCSIGNSVGNTSLDGGFSAPIASNGAFIVQDTTQGSGQIQYRLQQFAFSNTVGPNANINTPAGVGFQDVQFQNVASSGNRISVSRTASVICTRCAFRRTAGENVDNIIANSATGQITVFNSLFENGRSAILAGEQALTFNVVMVNPVQGFGIQARGYNTTITSFTCSGNTGAATGCVRWGDGDTTGYAKGQLRITSSSLIPAGQFGSSFGLHVVGKGVATITTSRLQIDAGTTYAAVYVSAGGGVSVDATSAVSTDGTDPIQLTQSGAFFVSSDITTIRAATPPCLSDAIGNFLCSP